MYSGFPDMNWLPGMDASNALATFMALYFGTLLLANLYSIAVYILHALGLYTIANRRGIHHPWLAWVPLGNVWILGSISDQYRYVARGQVKNRRKVLLAIAIIVIVIALAVSVLAIVLMVNAINAEITGASIDAQIMPLAIGMLICSLVIMALSVIDLVIEYMCYYDLFVSCTPDNGVVFLVLGIVFSFLLPFFVFAVRKKDLGMPPRKQPVAAPVLQIAQEETPAPAAEDPEE